MIQLIFCSLNSRIKQAGRGLAATRKAVSRTLHKYHTVSGDRSASLKQKNLKKNTEKKMMWGVRAYQDWRKNKLAQNCSYDKDVTDANLEDLTTVTKQNLENALCIFIAEVTKVCGEDFPGKTLYQLSVSIQKYLNESGLMWKLVDGPDFKQFRIVLDNVMKERVQQNIGMTVSIKPDTPINVYTWLCLNTAKSKFSLVSPVAD